MNQGLGLWLREDIRGECIWGDFRMLEFINNKLTVQMRSDKSHDRYEQEKTSKFIEYISKEMAHSRGSTYDKSRSRTNSRIFTTTNKNKHSDSFHPSELYSQPQLVKQRRGASILRSTSKGKCRESMSKFRKDFIKDASFNFYDGKDFRDSSTFKAIKEKRVKSTKEEINPTGALGVVFDEDLDVEEIHFQMVKLHQNLKLIQKQA